MQPYTQRLVDSGILEEDKNYFNFNLPNDCHEPHAKAVGLVETV